MPPAGASTGRPAASAICSVGASRGSTPITLMRPSYQAAMPPIRPPPPTATSSVSRSPAPAARTRGRRCPGPAWSRPDRRRGPTARPFGDVGLAGGQRLGVDLAADGQLGAVAADARDLGRRGDLGDEDARLASEPHGGVGHGGAVVAARCRGDPVPPAPRADGRLANAPRALKEPECCVSSSFRTGAKAASPRSSAAISSTGVRRRYGRMRS